MCVGDILGMCLGPIATCAKYLCGALGLGLLFTAGAVGIDLMADWPIILIILASILALIWCIMAYCGALSERDDEPQYLAKQFELICETQEIVRQYEVRHNYASELADGCIQISNTIIGMFFTQLIYALILLILFLLSTIWFIPVGTKAGFIVGLFFGFASITIIAWTAYTFAGRSICKVITTAIQNKWELYDFMYTVGFGVVLMCIASIYFIFLILFFLFKSLQGLSNDNKPQDKLQLMGICCCGYALGIIVCAFIYRESTSILGRSIFNAIDGLIKCDRNLSFNNPYISSPTKLLYVISNIISTQIVNLLDTAICIAVLTVGGFVIFSNSEEVSKENITWKSLLAPTLYFCVNVFCAVIVQTMKSMIWDNEVVRFTKMNIRQQVLITHLMTLFIFFFMPMVTILKQFSLKGIEAPETLAKEDITIRKITYCCILGQLSNLVLLSIGEWMTSHGCQPVRNLALSSSERILTQSFNYATFLSASGQIIIVLTLGIIATAAHALAGYAGILAAAAGFLINVLIIIPLYYIGSISQDGAKLCAASHVTQVVSERFTKMAWAARNYMIYLKITNAGSAILLALTFLGGALYLFKVDNNPLIDFNGIFGILFGIGLAFLIKGMTVGSVISISRIFDLNIYESGIAAEIAKRNNLTLSRFFESKHLLAIIWVYIITITDTILLFIFAYFFGKRGSPGFLLGHTVIILFLMCYSIINGTAMKQSRYYNEVDDKLSKRGNIYQSCVQGDMLATVVEESTAIPLIVYLLYNIILVTCAYPYFGGEGDLFVEKEAETKFF
ncbi:unnamed protein product [Paramecium pentaurelia]|uniref:H(+)-exporting diphosphatase n=1 Tax=Paramecium pentaurelia TaxID=43138 RepID=A0A8S1WAM0_9CILI|nr:unnamed protein product [Paramecium pentaurelia]